MNTELTHVNNNITMCSIDKCASRGVYNIDSVHYCKFHNPLELGVCGVIRQNGTVCNCPALRCYKNIKTCLVHIPKSAEVINCSICFEDCSIGTKSTKCGHFFHAKCLKEWKKQDNGHTCPMCRFTISKKPKSTVSLINRITEIARSSTDAETFMASLIISFTDNDLDMVLAIIRNN